MGVFGSGGMARRSAAVGNAPTPDQALSEAYYANVYFYACVRAIATDLAARPFRVGADPENPSDYDPNHPLAKRLSPPPGGPNPTTTARRLFAWSAAQRLVFGAVAWEIVPSDLSLWPLTATELDPVRQDDTRRIPQTGWYKEFKVGGSGNDSKVLKPDRVFYSWNPAQDDWGRPETALQAARLDVQVAVMQDIYDNAFLKNDARPAAIVVHQSFESDDDKRKFRRQFLNRHQGPGNAGRTAFVEASPQTGGAAPKDSIFVQTLGLSQRDAQFVERYDTKLRSICVAFGVPLSRLGDASKRTFSNADRETLNYWLDTVQPLGLDLADDINLRLMPLFDNSGNVGWFDWSGVPDLAPNKRFSVPEVQGLVRDGLLTPEEGRVEIGMPVDPTVGEFPVDLPDAPAAELLTTVEAPVALTAGEVADMLDMAVAKLSGEMRALPALPELPAVVDPAPVLDAAATAEVARAAAHMRRRKTWGLADRTVRREEAKWERKFNDLLDAQVKAALSRLTGKRGRQALTRDAADDAEIIAEQVFDRKFWESKTGDLFRELYGDLTTAALSAFDVSYGIAFDVTDPFAAKFIEARTNKLAGQVTQTTYDGIKGALRDGVANGESIPDLAARIEGLFSQTYANRATTVARTEVISAYNGSTAVAAVEAGPELVTGIEWIATLDDRTRDSHADLDGTIIEPGESFDIDGVLLQYPGDPSSSEIDPASEIINCRCTCAPVVADLPERTAHAYRPPPAALEARTHPLGELVINVKTGAAKHVVQRDADGRIIGLMEVES